MTTSPAAKLVLVGVSSLLVCLQPCSRAVDFGQRALSLGYWTETLVVENTTASTVNLTGDPRAVITGADAGDFAVALQPPAQIPPLGTVHVRVTFNPSTPGARVASLQIATDNPTLGTIAIDLDGSGGSPAVTDLSANLDHDLSGTQTGSVRLQQGKLNLTGDLSIEGDLVIDGGSVSFNGFDLSIGRDLRLDANVTITPASMLEVGGHFLQGNGWLNPNGSTVEIGGDYRIQTISEDGSGVLSFSSSPGRIEMNAAADSVIVQGSFATDSTIAHISSTLSQGTLEVHGDFTQLSNSAESRTFTASGSHRVLLAGDGPQLVSFEDPVSSKFEIMEIQNTIAGAVTLAPEFNADTLISNGVALAPLTVRGTNWNLSADEIVAGDLFLENRNLDLNGHRLTVLGDLIQSGGRLDVGGGNLVVEGDYRIQTDNGDGTFGSSAGLLEMNEAADMVTVQGNFVTDSTVGHITSTLSQGTLELQGDFTQLSTSTETRNFQPSGTHRVLISGSTPQVLSFEDPVSSKFEILEIQNPDPGAVTCVPTLNADTLVSNGIPLASLTISRLNWNLSADEVVAGDLFLEDRNLDLNGHSLTVRGDLIQSGGRLEVGGGSLVVEGDYRIQTDNGDGTFGSSAGLLEMNESADTVTVQGNFVTDSTVAHISTTLSMGTLELQGDFTQLSTSTETRSFQPSGDYRVLISGSSPQVLSFEDPVSSKFETLEIQNPDPGAVTFVPTLNADTLISNGIPLASLTVRGLNWNLSADEVVAGDLLLEDRNLDLNGHRLTVRGNLIQSGGRLEVGGGNLVVEGDYRIQTDNGDGTFGSSTGLLEMNESADMVTVQGNFVTDSTVGHSSTTLSQGTLELQGDFTQLSTSTETRNFQPSGTHRVLISGSSPQVLSFEDPVSSKFEILEIQNPDPGAVTIAPAFNADALVSNGIPLASLTISGLNWILSADEVVAGDLFLEDRNLDLNGHSLTVRGDLIQPGGRLDVGGGSLVVEGDYRIQTDNGDGTFGSSTGLLEMNESADMVTVQGNFVTDSTVAHSSTTLSQGTLELQGDFTQLSSAAETRNFQPTANHRVLLTGDSAQTISFADPGSSAFRRLEFLNNPVGLITFATRARATGLFDHHQRTFALAPDAVDTDFIDSDGDGVRDHLDLFPIGDSNNNGIPDDATPETYTYDAWRRIHFWEGDPDFEAKTAFDFDADGDRLTNLLEYLMGTIPTQGNANPLSVSVVTNQADGQRYLALSFPRVKAALGSAQLEVQGSSDLVSGWVPNTNLPDTLADDGEIESVRVLDVDPITTAARRLARLVGRLLP